MGRSKRMLDLWDYHIRMNICLHKIRSIDQHKNLGSQYNSIRTFVYYFSGRESKLDNQLHKFVGFFIHKTKPGIEQRIFLS